MFITDEQKRIIKAIADGKITDLLTFIANYTANEVFKFDSDEIRQRKKNDYERNKDNIDDYLSKIKKNESNFTLGSGLTYRNTEYSDEEKADFKKKLMNYSINESDFLYKIELGGQKFSINAFREEVYIVEEKHKKINDFLTVLEILKTENMLFLTDKEITLDDAKIYFNLKKKGGKKRKGEITQILKGVNLKDFKILPEDFISSSFNEKHFYKSNDKDYSDYDLIIDHDLLVITEEYVDKKIIVLPKLIKFVQDKFISFEEKKFKREQCLTIIAIFVSIIFSILSLYYSYMNNAESARLQKRSEEIIEKRIQLINTNLERIESHMIEINKGLTVLVKNFQAATTPNSKSSRKGAD